MCEYDGGFGGRPFLELEMECVQRPMEVTLSGKGWMECS